MARRIWQNLLLETVFYLVAGPPPDFQMQLSHLAPLIVVDQAVQFVVKVTREILLSAGFMPQPLARNDPPAFIE